MVETLQQWAARLAQAWGLAPRAIAGRVLTEAEHLAAEAGRLAPRRSGRLARSFEARGPRVTSTAPYAGIASTGGVVRATRGWLVIPVRRNYWAGAPGFVTVGANVFRRGGRELWAVRRREVLLRGSGYLDRALNAHMRRAEERMASVLPDVEVRGG